MTSSNSSWLPISRSTLSSLLLAVSLHFAGPPAQAEPVLRPASNEQSISPNAFLLASDSDAIQAAIADALSRGVNSIVIPRLNTRTGKPIWLLDRAIQLPSDFTLYLQDSRVQLAPGVKDNLITNTGARTSPPSANQNIRIIGTGNAVLCGGTEAHWEKPGDKNGWRTIGILLYDTALFSLEGFRMEETHTWAISLENGCAYGRVSNIDFQNTNKYPNQDGVDLRKGCHDIIIENITGVTGDDTIALTGLRSVETMPADQKADPASMQIGYWQTDRDDMYNITIRNIKTQVAGGHHIVRLLNQDGVKMYNIFIRDIMDTSRDGEKRAHAAVKIGDVRYSTLSKAQKGDTSRVFVDNVLTRAEIVVKIQGTLQDSAIRDVTGYGGSSKLVEYGEAPVENVTVEGKLMK